ncbi:DUF2933 domain-containing protein [Actinoplanes campanulatus]|nr:DUF2933 domain-containing protein [Actinoplanes capillaceus]
MRRQPWGLYAIATAILVVGLIALGVPANTLLFAAFLLTCPLMMIFMMGGMRAGHGVGQNAHALDQADAHAPDSVTGGSPPVQDQRRSR